VPVVANWSMSSIPRAIPADQVRQLLAGIDRRTAMGCRDYAILLLLARLGLRSGEVAFLELDDIDWKTGKLSVRGKSGRRSDLPLPAEVGKAIAAYLRNQRPQSTDRRVFLRVKAPIRGFRGASGVGSIVRHCILRAGLDTPTYGAHQFRHGLATELLRQGASLGEIGELLGHRGAGSRLLRSIWTSRSTCSGAFVVAQAGQKSDPGSNCRALANAGTNVGGQGRGHFPGVAERRRKP
jgi:integrase